MVVGNDSLRALLEGASLLAYESTQSDVSDRFKIGPVVEMFCVEVDERFLWEVLAKGSRGSAKFEIVS